ncbi:MAG: TatD family hydrolase [Nitrososphaerota archaeon]|nr:TatD family hydrolase [Nitrososphaerota archaeon]MCL5671966.1 TatD family hydrolase [Nitrososphaerota archaeon]MDG6912687.1 TatD family hydrolase [Nitrososphaerota archaeon]MDG6937008.1 TatD family hydrolase [Nitrososphaerota archaeon]MDG6952155.1 TatD family hydrolase [Nitrososphaerota archaeon]
MRFFDSHLHLDSPDSALAMANASSAGVVLLACGVDRETSEGVVAASAAHPGTVVPFVGLHPSEAEKCKDLAWVPGMLERSRGLGEVGLDPSYSPTAEGSAQLNAFRYQLQAAEGAEVPVQVHSRGAEAQVLEVLGSFRVGPLLMHWLEAEDALPAVIQRGYFVSFGPALLYSKKLQRMARRCDPAFTLVESDSPVAYGPLGGVHGPALVPSVAFRLAELWGVPPLDAISLTSGNALRYLGTTRKVNDANLSGLTEVG